MFNPFSRPKVPGFNVRPEDLAPGFRVSSPPEVIGFNIDDTGLPRPGSSGPAPAPYPFGWPQDPSLSPPPLGSPDQAIPDWLHTLLSMPLPSPSAPPGVRWSVPDALLVRPVSDPAAEPFGMPGGPEAEGSVPPQPSEDAQSYPQADAAGDQAPPAPPPWSGGSGVDPNFILANADGDGVQEAQQTRPLDRGTPPPVPPGSPVPTGPATSRRQSPTTRREMSGEDLTQLEERRREQALNEVRYKIRREERVPYWDYILRQLPIPPLPAPAGRGIQEPLPHDWREALRKINPSYLEYTEAAARKYGIPPELLARLLYRESNYKNQGVDSNGNPVRNDIAVGIPQMFPPALKDVGVDPRTFGRAGAAAQIDAGAAYLARQYRRFGDWPRAVAAYNIGANKVEDWLAGKTSNYDNITQRTNEESADFRGKARKDGKPETVEDRQVKAEERAKDDLKPWRQLQAYLPYIFLGDPGRYDRPTDR